MYSIEKRALPLEARLAIEWMMAGGERSEPRLQSLVAHFCTTNAISDPQTRDAIYAAARAAVLHTLAA